MNLHLSRSRSIILISALILILAALVPFTFDARAAAPATYYVASNGSDSNPGTLDRPFRTFGFAISRLNAGDTLFVRGGNYVERVRDVALHAGTPSARIRVQNYNGERPVIVGLLWIKNASYWTFSGINATWDPSNGNTTEHMVKLTGGTGWAFTSAEIWGAHSFAGLMISGGAQQWSVSWLYVHDTYRSNNTNQDHLLYVSQAYNGTIEHCVLANSENGRGIKLARPSAGDAAPAYITVRYNTFIHNAGANASTSYDAHDNQIYGNVMVDSGSYENVTAMSLASGANTVVHDNVGWRSGNGSVVEANAGLTDGGNNRAVDPALDANLRPTNPALIGADGSPIVGHLANGATQPQPGTPTPTTPTPTPTTTVTPSPTTTSTPSPTPSPTKTPVQPTGATVLVNDAFDSAATGQVPQGWYDARNAANGTLAVTSLTSGGKSLRAAVTASTGDVRPDRSFDQISSGTITLQSDVMLNKKPASSSVYVSSLKGNGQNAVTVMMSKSGSFSYFNGAKTVSTGAKYALNTWYRVKVTVNVSTRKFDVLITRVSDGRALVSAHGVTWRDPSLPGVDRIHFQTSDGDVGLALYIDNVRLTVN